MNKYKMEELIPIVAELTDKYTCKESTSISYTLAKQFMNAIIYCLNELESNYNEFELYENELKNERKNELNNELNNEKNNERYTEINNERNNERNKSAVKNMAEELNAKLAYKKGYELVLKKVLKTKDLFEEIALDFNSYRSQAYYETVIDGMPAFFSYYDPKFNPQNHLLTLDYPTIDQVQDVCGIDAIYKYLSYTKLEQDFLKAYPEKYITTLLSSHQADYEELFINIASIVLRNVIACVVVGKKITSHSFEKKDFDMLRKFVEDSTEEELEVKIIHIIRIIVDRGYNHNQQLCEYLQKDVKNISFELRNAVKNDCLEVTFLL